MAIPILTVGDDIGLLCTLQINAAGIGIDPSSVIKASVSNVRKTKSFTGSVTLASDDANHTLGQGIVWVVIPAADTATMEPGPAILEIEVNDPTRLVGDRITTYTSEVKVDPTAIT